MRGFLLAGEIDNGDGIVESREDVEQVMRVVESQAAGPAAGYSDLVGGAGDEAVVFKRGGLKYADFARSQRSHVERLAVARYGHVGGEGQTLDTFGVRSGSAAVRVIDVL